MAGIRGKSGRRPKPSYLKVLQGTNRPDRVNESEAMPDALLERAPLHLSKAARQEWRRMGERLLAVGLITVLDNPAFALYCEAWAKWREAEDRLAAEGMVYLAPSGAPHVSPYYQIAAQERQAAYRFLIEFGMTPASRSRVKAAPKPQAADPFEEFLNGGQNSN